MTSEWQDFFGLLSQVSVTAFAVLLATLQLARRRWMGSKLKEVSAVLALLELLVVLLASLVASMPGGYWRVGYIVMGVVGLIGVAWHVSASFRYDEEADEFDDQQVRWGVPVSTVVYSGVVIFAAGGLVGGVAILSIWLIFAGSGEAWLLLDADRSARPHADSQRTGGVESAR